MQRSDGEEQGGPGEQRSSPARPPFGKKQLPSIPKNAVPITKAASPASSTQSANGTHASYGPFYLEYSLLAELWVMICFYLLAFMGNCTKDRVSQASATFWAIRVFIFFIFFYWINAAVICIIHLILEYNLWSYNWIKWENESLLLFSSCLAIPLSLTAYFKVYVWNVQLWPSVCCSTLVIKQKLPGIYVQPSYRSALSKDVFLSVLSVTDAFTQNALKLHSIQLQNNFQHPAWKSATECAVD